LFYFNNKNNFQIKGFISRQFHDLKFGDNFFYEHGHNVYSRFTLNQLNSIKQYSYERAMCDAYELENIQKKGFYLFDTETNPYVKCDTFVNINFNFWKSKLKNKKKISIKY
jgi:hypothetical protein